MFVVTREMLKKITPFIWEIPKTGKMNVSTRIFASEKLLEKIKQDRTLEQGRNIERSIQDLISKLDLKVRTYKLFWAAEDDLRNLEDLIKILGGKLSQS